METTKSLTMVTDPGGDRRHGPDTWSIASGTLPAKLVLNSSGVISGTPTTDGGLTTVTFRVTDTTSTTATKSLSITTV